jgi:predicted metal-binding membrane protein
MLVPGRTTVILHHHAEDLSSMVQNMPSHLLLAVVPDRSAIVGWAVMLVAMMSPALIFPICHIRLRSFRQRRDRAVALFVAAYMSAWMVFGYLVLTMKGAIVLLAGRSYLPVAIALIAAFVWQFSPVKQHCLNGCHRNSNLAAFGIAADIEVLRYGVTHAAWCIGSCWLLMLLPLLWPVGHTAAMVSVTALIFSERLEYPGWPCWKWRISSKGFRIALSQLDLHLRSMKMVPSA